MPLTRKYTRGKILLSFLAAVVSIGFFVLITYRNMLLTESESRHINTTVERLLKLNSLKADIQDIESGQRGFIITGEEQFLETYYSGLNELKQDTLVLLTLGRIDTARTAVYANLLQLIKQKVAYAKYAVELRRLFGANAASVYMRNEQGFSLMHQIREELGSLENRNRQKLEKSIRNRELLSQKRSWQLFSLAVIFYIILFINYRVITRDYNIQQENEKVLKYNASLISIISDAVVTTDQQYLVTNWNKYAEQMYGYTEEEARGKPLHEILKDQPGFPGNEAPGMASFGTDNWRGERIHFTKDGQQVNADVMVSVIRDVEGSHVGTVSVIRNITERKKTEKRLQELTLHLEEEVRNKVKELNAVFDRITDAFIALDTQWRYTYVNKKAAELHGREAENLIGKNIWEEYPDLVGEPFYHALMQASRDQVSRRRELYYSKSGMWFEDLIYPSPDGISVYYHDITKRKHAEQLLQQSERELKISNERFMLVSRATNDAVWDWDMVNDVIWGNESFCNIFNIKTEDKIRFHDYIQTLHPTDRDAVLLGLKQALDSKKTLITEEFRIQKADGSLMYVFDRAYVLYNEEGRAYRMLGAMQDITIRKQAQAEILQEKELSDSIINSLPGVFFIASREGKLFRWNRNLEIVSGYDDETLRNLHIRELIAGHQQKLMERTIESVFMLGEFRMEADLFTRDGLLIPHYFTGMEISYEGERCMMGVGIDISEQVKSQKELLDSEAKYRLLFNQNPMPMAMITMPERKIIDVNEAAVDFYGFSEEEFRQMHMQDLLAAETSEWPASSPNEMGISDAGVWRQKKKDGTLVLVNIITHDLLYEGKEVQLLLANDVTEKIEAEEALKKSHKDLRLLAIHLQDVRENERTHIAREIHDELGQQLTGLKMDISWLSKKITGPSPEVSQKLTEALSLIDDTVKTVRRIATQLRPSILDDLGLVSAMEWQSEEFEKRFNIQTVFHSGLGNIAVDKEVATGLFRIFQECLTNVLRHSKATEVKSMLSNGQGVLRLRVTDNGIGFDSTEIESKKTLGLLGMKERTQMLGGTYEINSRPGEGTTVLVTIPLHNN